jgi:hypothetical protein
MQSKPAHHTAAEYKDLLLTTLLQKRCIFSHLYSKMTIVINKSNFKSTSKILSEKLKKSEKKGKLSKHFGKLKRNIDGLTYQTSMRENEN